jgi:aminoglycoside/choline kinase family phosphotransferase
VDEASGRYWLFLERLVAVELYQVGEIETWQLAAKWLAQLHAHFAHEAQQSAFGQAVQLLKYDADFYWLWPSRAREYINADSSLRRRATKEDFERLVRRYGEVVRRLLDLPTTLIHGEFYASNVLIQQAPQGLRVCPVDWEMAAVAPGLMDLAALTAGRWTQEERTALAVAYHEALLAHGVASPPTEECLTMLDYCRLHVAMQWLGWATDWQPPAEHMHDWLNEALQLGHALGLL